MDRRLTFLAALSSAAGLALASPGDLPEANRAVLQEARRWVERHPRYDASYRRIPFPGGDVPADRGACVDLVVRALRAAGFDLQRLIHEDRLARPSAYPGHPPPDTNLDHRRSVNHVAFLRRHARPLPVGTGPEDRDAWLPGDLVYYGRRRAWHAGIVSDRRSPGGIPYIIDSHQDQGGVSERHLLTHWGPILAHFRPADIAVPGP